MCDRSPPAPSSSPTERIRKFSAVRLRALSLDEARNLNFDPRSLFLVQPIILLSGPIKRKCGLRIDVTQTGPNGQHVLPAEVARRLL